MWDQTERKWLVGLDPYELGTGLYLFPYPLPSDPKAAHKVFDQDITYSECKMRGDDKGALAIKWVPHTIAPYDLLRRTQCGAYCKDTCVQFGCVCNPQKNECE
jgi:hypothetical protein